LWLAICGAVFAIIGIYYYLRIVKVMYFDEADEGAAAIVKPADAPMRAVISVNGLALLVLGLTWGPLYDWCALALGIAK
jgi:NADH-quinone oxidoreductase subunit N